MLFMLLRLVLQVSKLKEKKEVHYNFKVIEYLSVSMKYFH